MNILCFLIIPGKLWLFLIATTNLEEEKGKKLLEDACKGDERAFEELVRTYMKWAYTLAYRLSGEHFLAEEISQDAFVALHQNIRSFRQESTLKTYLSKIILNLWRQYLRKKYREMKFTDTLKRRSGGSNRDNLIEVENDDLKEKINDAITTLPLKQKEIFILKHLEGLKISEVAKIIGCREGTVKAHLFKALVNLRKKLE